MNAIATAPSIQLKGNVLTTTSIAVAEFFKRRHADVISKIEKLDCSNEFTSTNFIVYVKNIDIGQGATRKSKAYEITQDGFSFLAMGFTGKTAARFKEAYITTFRKMQTELLKKYQQPAIPTTITPEQQRIIQEAVAELAHENKAYAKYYGAIKTYFKIAKYDQLPADKLEEALEVLQGVVVQPKAIDEPATLDEFDEPAKNNVIAELRNCDASQQTFHFGDYPIRIEMRDGSPWFVGLDVSQVLGFARPKEMMRNCDESDKSYTTAADKQGRYKTVLLISLSALFIAITYTRQAQRPNAKPFLAWLSNTLLPSIMLANVSLPEPTPIPAPIPDDMILVNRQSFEALKNRVVLIYKRQRELDAIKASVDPIIAQLNALKNDVDNYVEKTNEPVSVANILATSLGSEQNKLSTSNALELFHGA